MKRVYSVLIITDEMRTSPAIYALAKMQNILLRSQQQETITISTPSTFSDLLLQAAELEYNHDVLEITNCTLTQNDYLVTCSLTCIGREVGHTTVTLHIPSWSSQLLVAPATLSNPLLI